VLKAWPRQVTGHKLKGLRKQGQTPGILFSLPDNSSQLVALDSKEITHTVSAAGGGFAWLRCNAFSAAHGLLAGPAQWRRPLGLLTPGGHAGCR